MADSLVSPLAVHPSPTPAPAAATVGAAQENQPDISPTEPQAPGATSGPSLPKEIAKMPAFHALLAGSPPAVSFSAKGIEHKTEAHLLNHHKKDLQKAGFGFYRSLSGHHGVIFNQLYVAPQDVQAADRAGKLHLLAPDFDSVNHAVSKSGMANPILNIKNLPGGFAQPRSGVAPQTSSGIGPGATGAPGNVPTPSPMPSRPMGAGAQRKLLASRVTSLEPGGPLSGPQPGAGRLLNSVLKPVV